MRITLLASSLLVLGATAALADHPDALSDSPPDKHPGSFKPQLSGQCDQGVMGLIENLMSAIGGAKATVSGGVGAGMNAGASAAGGAGSLLSLKGAAEAHAHLAAARSFDHLGGLPHLFVRVPHIPTPSQPAQAWPIKERAVDEGKKHLGSYPHNYGSESPAFPIVGQVLPVGRATPPKDDGKKHLGSYPHDHTRHTPESLMDEILPIKRAPLLGMISDMFSGASSATKNVASTANDQAQQGVKMVEDASGQVNAAVKAGAGTVTNIVANVNPELAASMQANVNGAMDMLDGIGMQAGGLVDAAMNAFASMSADAAAQLSGHLDMAAGLLAKLNLQMGAGCNMDPKDANQLLFMVQGIAGSAVNTKRLLVDPKDAQKDIAGWQKQAQGSFNEWNKDAHKAVDGWNKQAHQGFDQANKDGHKAANDFNKEAHKGASQVDSNARQSIQKAQSAIGDFQKALQKQTSKGGKKGGKSNKRRLTEEA